MIALYQSSLPEITGIIGYLRRSRQDIERERKTGEDTLSTQRKIMTKVLDDITIPYDMVEEIGSGDKIETRPVFQQVLGWLRALKYNGIAVKEIARLGRGSYGDMGQIFDLIEEKRIYIVTPYKIYDVQNFNDKRQIRFELFFAREEFETIRERMLSSKLNLAHEGRWVVGATPYGYRLNQTTTRLEINEELAVIVRLIFDLYVNGIPQPNGEIKDVAFKAISTYLNTLGIPSPRNSPTGWHYLTVKRIIENVAYIGVFEYRKRKRVGNKYTDRPESEHITVEDAHEPIISRDVWEAAQAKINGRPKPKVKQDFSPCELASLVVCTKCGRRMVRQYSVQHYKKKDGSESVYHKEFLWCTTNGCTFVKYRDAEEDILLGLEQMNALNIDQLKKIFADTAPAETPPQNGNGIYEMIEKKRKELKRTLDFVREKYEKGIYDDEDYIERKAAIKKELAKLDSLSPGDAPANSPQVEKAVLDYKTNLQHVLEVYQTLTNKTKKNTLLSSVIKTVELTKTGKGTYDLKITPYFNIKLV